MTNVIKSEQNIERAIGCYAQYRDNWDENGGVAPDKVALSNAEKFLNIIFKKNDIDLPSVYLSSDGEINFIWDIPDSPIYIDIGFINSGYSYYAIDKNNKKLFEK